MTRYSPYYLNKLITTHLNSNTQLTWVASKQEIGQSKDTKRPIYLKAKCKNNIEIFVTAPCNDADTEEGHTAAGGLKINTVISEIMKVHFPENSMRIFIPLAQTKPMLMGVTNRNHWSLLVLEVGDDKVARITNYDSQPFYVSYWYGLTHIQEELLQHFPDSKYEHVCYGHQSLTDFSNCGRFVISYLSTLLANEDPAKLNVDTIMEEMSKFEKLADQKKGKTIKSLPTIMPKNHIKFSEKYVSHLRKSIEMEV
jgi:hypothetical protein